MRLDQMPWPDVSARAAASLLAVPVGSTEQHGPHLPLSTDTSIALELCDRLAAARSDVLVAPPLAYGAAGEHAGFPGTLSIGSAVTEELLVEIGRSADEFAGMLFVSTHGGNGVAVTAAVVRLQTESRQVRAWWPGSATGPAEGGATGQAGGGAGGGAGGQCGGQGGGDAHAGRTETSVILAVQPGSVRSSAAVAGCTTPIADLMPVLRIGGVRAVSPNGVLGDPAGASAEEGREILARWAADLIGSVAGWP